MMGGYSLFYDYYCGVASHHTLTRGFTAHLNESPIFGKRRPQSYREVKADVNKLPVAIFPHKQMRCYGNAAYSSLFNCRFQLHRITHFLENFNKKLTFYQN